MNRIAKFLPAVVATTGPIPITPPIFSIEYNNKGIARMQSDGLVEITLEGWRTPEVKHRLNAFIKHTGWIICQSKGLWYICNKDRRYAFSDNLQLFPNGDIAGCVCASADQAVVTITAAEIHKYVTEYLRRWAEGVISPPGTGDPWNLYRRVYDKIPPDEDLRLYLQLYIQQGYYFGSLLMAVLVDAGGDNTKHLGFISKRHIKEWLARGKPCKCKLLTSCLPALDELMCRYLFKVFKE